MVYVSVEHCYALLLWSYQFLKMFTAIICKVRTFFLCYNLTNHWLVLFVDVIGVYIFNIGFYMTAFALLDLGTRKM
jgi:hypothetical protein